MTLDGTAQLAAVDPPTVCSYAPKLTHLCPNAMTFTLQCSPAVSRYLSEISEILSACSVDQELPDAAAYVLGRCFVCTHQMAAQLPACLAGVKAGCVHLCRVEGNTV